MNAKEHYEAGNLSEAVTAATEEVKQRPTDTSRRGFLGIGLGQVAFGGDGGTFDGRVGRLNSTGRNDPLG